VASTVLIYFIYSLDDFIDGRLGRSTYTPHLQDEQQADSNSLASPNSDGLRSRSARKRAFREQQQKKKEDRPQAPTFSPSVMKAVHLLSAQEVRSLFSDVTEGLAFLVSTANAVYYLNSREVQAREVNTSSGSQAWKCSFDLGSGKADVRRSFIALQPCTNAIKLALAQCSLISEPRRICSTLELGQATPERRES
jgi:hypothetical protein